jgi:hypothetical protein
MVREHALRLPAACRWAAGKASACLRACRALSLGLPVHFSGARLPRLPCRSTHGIALNVSTDLSLFDLVVPCGVTDKRMTSLAQVHGSGGACSRGLGTAGPLRSCAAAGALLCCAAAMLAVPSQSACRSAGQAPIPAACAAAALQEVGRASLPYDRVCQQLQDAFAAAFGYGQLQQVVPQDMQRLAEQHREGA